MFRIFKGEGVDDLVMASSPSNSSLTGQLSARFAREQIYTNLGEVLVSVNPYKYLPITGEEYIKLYQFSAGSGKAAPPPHIYALAERMYRRLSEENESQCVIISGESGAGKTVGAKLILQYITAVSPNGSGSSSSSSSSSSSYGGGGGGGGGYGGGGGGYGGGGGGGGGDEDSGGYDAQPAAPPRPMSPVGGRGGPPPIPGRGGRGGAPPPIPGRGGRGGPPGGAPRGRGGPPPAGGPPGGGAPRGRGGPPMAARGGRGGAPMGRGGGGGGGGFGGGGGGPINIETVKKVIIESNPLMEAFGNAKTVRNDNSSRFGKYLEVQFNDAAAPVGGMITTFLLEKTRVAFQGKGERNFHIFYQLMAGAEPQWRHAHTRNTHTRLMPQEFGLGNSPTAFSYLAQSGCTTVDDVDDAADLAEVRKAMRTVGISDAEQYEIFRILAGILWLGNVTFTGGAPANIVDQQPMETAAFLLQLPPEILGNSLTHKAIVSGSARQTQYQVPQNPEQSTAIRDALAKTLYARVFDWIVAKVNAAMAFSGNCNVVGVLDIYGFEIFEHNSFEQFCINYVNERLQQIFIELTVRGEQEEYHAEGMKWKDIKFFDNKVVCELIEGSNPPGLFRVLDDICRSVHAADADTLDQKYIDKIKTMQHEHLAVSPGSQEFTVEHYAGSVTYDAKGFPAKNKDTLFVSLVMCMQESASSFVHGLFPEDVSDDKKAPATAGTQIRQSASYLVQRLSACTPHYIRCIKPNDKKTPMDFNSSRVEHQVKYLGLLENVKVKRSGYAYRHYKDFFLKRYGVICTKNETDPQPSSVTAFVDWLKANHGSEVDAAAEFEEGKTKVFVKNPETIYFLEELLYKRTDPEGYKLKVQEYKQREKLAQRQGRNGLKPKCILQ